MCVCAHSRNWPAKVVECSEPSLGFFIGLFCNTHVFVHSSTWSTNPQLSSSATHVCVFTAAIGLPKSLKESKLQLTCSAPDMCVFRNTHVYAHKQQLVGQPFTLGCNPTLNGLLLKHTCVCAHSSNWSAEVVGCSEPSLGLLIEFFCKTDVCVFTAAIGRLTLR